MATSDKTKRFLLILLAVGLLVIFSVTGSMAMFFGDLFQGGDVNVATFQLDGEERVITNDEYLNARLYHQLQERMPELGVGERSGQESWVTYQVLKELADHHGVAVSKQELASYLSAIVTRYRIADYEGFWRSRGFNSVGLFESSIAEVLRVARMRDMLAAASVPTSKQVLEWWSEQYQEMRLQYGLFDADDFLAAAAEEEPDEDTLQEFFETGLTPSQKRELESEEWVSFEIVMITKNHFDTNKLAEWFEYTEPDEDTLRGFYDVHRFDLYLRSVDEDQVLDPSLDPILTFEEVQYDVPLHHKLMDAARQLATRTGDLGETPLVEWAGGMNLDYFRYPETERSELTQLELIGSKELDKLFRTPVGTFLAEPIYNSEQDAIYLARAYEIQEREQGDLADTREKVLEFWREKRALELAQEAAQEFVDNVPEPEDYVEGDPIGLPADAFEQLLSEAGVEVQTLDWISGVPRPTVDPKWGKDEAILPWFRANVARDLENMIDEQVIGPLDHPTARVSIVARLDGRRDADPQSIWPGELERARQGARSEFARRYYDENLTFEGMQRAYDIQWVRTENEEDAGDEPVGGQ